MTRITLKKTESSTIMMESNPILYMDASNSLFEPIMKPMEKISTMIDAKVALPRLIRFLFCRKKPSSIPAINGISKLGKFSIIHTHVR
jgi:hypothetical protein